LLNLLLYFNDLSILHVIASGLDQLH